MGWNPILACLYPDAQKLEVMWQSLSIAYLVLHVMNICSGYFDASLRTKSEIFNGACLDTNGYQPYYL